MRNLFLVATISTVMLAACDPSNNNNNSYTCSGTNNMCFDLNGNTISGVGYWYDLVGSKMCVYLSDSLNVISIDIGQYMYEQDYSITTGTLYSPNSRITYTDKSSMPYVDYKATTGMVTVTNANTTNNTISGTFSGPMQNLTTLATYDVANFKFVDVPHQ
jgi:hypothetical protein